LQGGAQDLFLRALDAAGEQADAAVFGGQGFDQHAGFAPGADVEDEGWLGDDPHFFIVSLRLVRWWIARA
jgi:hypothetical protein